MITNCLVSQPTELHRQLESVLLGYGGRHLVCLPDAQMQRLIDEGIVMRGRALMRRGKPSSCHENVAWMWGNNHRDYRIATGYALSDDGLWRQHSWLINSDGRIVETTEKRVLYYGYMLSIDEAARFAFSNLPRQRADEVMARWAEQAAVLV